MIAQYIIKRIEKLKKPQGKHDGHRNDDYAWCYECLELIGDDYEWTNNKPYNQAIDDVIKLLKP